MKFNSVTVAPVRTLEVGDLIAREFLGDVISGKITGIAHAGYQLTDKQKDYMRGKNLDIPENEYEFLGGPTQCLIFGEFRETRFHEQSGHMFVDYDVNVAVFPYKKKEQEGG